MKVEEIIEANASEPCNRLDRINKLARKALEGGRDTREKALRKIVEISDGFAPIPLGKHETQPCRACKGVGYFDSAGWSSNDCTICKGTGRVPSEVDDAR